VPFGVDVVALAFVLALVEDVLEEPPHAASTRLARISKPTAATTDLGLLLLGADMELLVDVLLTAAFG
jgi:hypothetical protein